MNIDLGRVTPIYRGIYAAGASYELNDIVLYSNGCLYWHTKPEATTGVAPTDTAAWTLAFSGDDVEAAIEQIKEDAEAIAFGTRGGLPVGSSDPYYHNNAAWYASQASASATDANAAKVAAQGAQGAAETARDKSAQWATGGSSGTPGATNNSKYYSEQAAGSAAAAAGSAQDAEAWAAGTKAGVPVTGDDPQYENNAKYWSDEAAASAATFVTDPTLSVSGKAADAAAVGAFNQYISLREEEDRQILFGSVVDAAEDSYSELRSAPIHNAITIGGSVYPRMDRTRMAIDAIRGRTVAFNQLVNHAGTTAGGITFTVSGGVVSFSGTPSSSAAIYAEFALPSAHKVMILCTVTDDGSHVQLRRRTSGAYSAVFSGAYSSVVEIPSDTDIGQIRLREMTAGTSYSGTFTMQIFDLTQMYGSTLADSIYAMEQATAGAGVAYVRQRMDLDYYASNSGELKAPVASGVSFTGANVFDISVANWKHNKRISTTDGSIIDNNSFMYGAYYYPALPEGRYTMRYIKGTSGNLGVSLALYDSAKVWQQNIIIAPSTPQTGEIVSTFDFPVGFAYFRVGTIENDYNPTLTISGGTNPTTDPYRDPITLPIPTTTLNGVGTAQDELVCVEVAENDYSLIKRSLMIDVDLGTLNYTEQAMTNNRKAYYTPISELPAYSADTPTAPPNAITPVALPTYQAASSWPVGSFVFTHSLGVLPASVLAFIVADTTYADAAAFKSAMSGKYLCYEKVTPTETVIAEHLTLAEVSALAENGGIISVENSNGHIVQPDMVCDVVVSRSAS